MFFSFTFAKIGFNQRNASNHHRQTLKTFPRVPTSQNRVLKTNFNRGASRGIILQTDLTYKK